MNDYNEVLNTPYFQEFLKTFSIKVLAPASGIKPDKLTQLQNLPYIHLDCSPLPMSNEIPYHSNSDGLRLKQLIDALYNPADEQLIWTLRGGYGSARLLEALSQLPKPPKEKIVIGFSDITALNLFLSQHWQWQPIHGCGISQILDPELDPLNFTKIMDLISGKSPLILLDQLLAFNSEAIITKSIHGHLTGGNLTLIETSIGTPWQIQTAGKIVFLEEVGEKGYRIDRSLNHLKQAGLWKDVKALILGNFLYDTQDETINVALKRFAEEVIFPVFKTSEFGHGSRNYPLQYNILTELKTSKDHYSLIKS